WMDEAAIEAQGAKPLADELRRIAAIGTLPQLEEEIARLQTFGVNAGFQFGSEPDRKDSSNVIAAAAQGGLGLPERDYYFKTDPDSKAIRAKYVAHVTKMFQLLGEKKAAASAHARTVLACETKPPKSSRPPVAQGAHIAPFNKRGRPAPAKLPPNFSWAASPHAVGAPAEVPINVQQPKFFQNLSKQLTSEPIPN